MWCVHRVYDLRYRANATKYIRMLDPLYRVNPIAPL